MARAVDINSNVVPIMPDDLLKVFLPKSPSNKKPASGNKGISAMYVVFGINISFLQHSQHLLIDDCGIN